MQNWKIFIAIVKKFRYYSMIYDIDVPLTHMILNKRWKQKDIFTSLEKISIISGDEKSIKGSLNFYEIPNPIPANYNGEDEEKHDNSPLEESLFQILRNYEDPEDNLI